MIKIIFLLTEVAARQLLASVRLKSRARGEPSSKQQASVEGLRNLNDYLVDLTKL